MNKVTIEGVTITDSVIQQLKDWQDPENLDMNIQTLEEAIDMVLAQDEVTDINSPNATAYLNMIKNLRELAKKLQKFNVDKENT